MKQLTPQQREAVAGLVGVVALYEHGKAALTIPDRQLQAAQNGLENAIRLYFQHLRRVAGEEEVAKIRELIRTGELHLFLVPPGTGKLPQTKALKKRHRKWLALDTAPHGEKGVE